ncbi:MAG: histidine triad nucleotide-binding protein [Elusimicrobia bacterium]|nr:histidine triad nucleotide-binding protein [Elusimicrobiota bacterium]
MDCIFCKIASGETEASIIYEDEDILAFKDLNPQAPTHILIIPKKHIESLSACSQEDSALLGNIQTAAAKIAKELNVSEAFRLVTNNGAKAGQSVKHLHYHLLAGRRMMWPPG